MKSRQLISEQTKNRFQKLAGILNESTGNSRTIEIQTDDNYEYTLVSAQEMGNKTAVILHSEELYGEPDVKKLLNMPIDKFISMFERTTGAKSDPGDDDVYFDTNADKLKKLLSKLGFSIDVNEETEAQSEDYRTIKKWLENNFEELSDAEILKATASHLEEWNNVKSSYGGKLDQYLQEVEETGDFLV